jgi:hypothetical protein
MRSQSIFNLNILFSLVGASAFQLANRAEGVFGLFAYGEGIGGLPVFYRNGTSQNLLADNLLKLTMG